MNVSLQCMALLENGAKVVDVRTPGEFVDGHAEGAINIPLQDIQSKVDEIKSWGKPVVLCCASGMRSGQATAFLSSQGVSCANAGSWFNLMA